jgi:hypothetical protein
LNQKLCDIRAQSASAAITNMDLVFQAANANLNERDLSLADIISLRQEFAQDLFQDKKFIFGKYTLSSDGTVRVLYSPNIVIVVLLSYSTDPQIATVSRQSPFTNLCLFFQAYQGCKEG